MSDGITDAHRRAPLEDEIAYYTRLKNEAQFARDRNLVWYYEKIIERLIGEADND